MSNGIRVPYDEAKKIADNLVDQLSPACQRIEIAGSLRRKEPMVGDIEIVLILPIAYNLFGDPEEDETFALHLLDLALAKVGCICIKNGKKYKRVVFRGKYKVDLFITTPQKWGCIFTIRTGSAEFTKRLVTNKKYGGLCPSDLKFHEGRIWRIPLRTPEEEEVRLFFDGLIKEDYLNPLDTPEEADVFKALGIDYVDPDLRAQ